MASQHQPPRSRGRPRHQPTPDESAQQTTPATQPSRPARTAPTQTRSIDNPFCLHVAQSNLHPIDYSLTISKLGGDVPQSLLTRCSVIGNHYFVKYFFAFERGSREQHLHVQGIFTAMSQDTTRAATAAAACFKAEIPIGTADHMRVSVKPLTGMICFLPVLPHASSTHSFFYILCRISILHLHDRILCERRRPPSLQRGGQERDHRRGRPRHYRLRPD